MNLELNRIQALICLDFDGVLFDTAKEAYIMAREAYFGDIADQPTLDSYEQFLLLRPFVLSAWQYRLVFELISSEMDNAVLLQKYREKSIVYKPQTMDRDFEQNFNRVRDGAIKQDKKAWLRLHEPYSFFEKIKSTLIECPQYFQIVSTKGKRFILELLISHNVPWGRDQVWGRDEFEKCGQSKAAILESYASAKDILFIDDSEQHLNELNHLDNVECILANWGYTEGTYTEDNTDFVVLKVKKYLDRLHCSY